MITIRDLSIAGDGIGQDEESGKVVFIPKALPGEKVSVAEFSQKGKLTYGSIKELTAQSSQRVTPFCSYFEHCGGCQIQHLSYDGQLDWKTKHLQTTLKKIGNIEIEPQKIIGLKTATGYRNKAQFPLKKTANEPIKIGFYAPLSHTLIDIEDCPVSQPKMNAVFKTIKATLQVMNPSIYNETEHKGLIRHILLRYSKKEDKVWVIFVINGLKLHNESAWVDHLKCEEVGGISVNINTQKGNTILGAVTKTIWGKDRITEDLGSLKIQFLPTSFSQTIWEQAQTLYSIAIEETQISDQDTVWDLFCGVGPISLLTAQRAKQVLGLESSTSSITLARENADSNTLKNITFQTQNLEFGISQALHKQFPPNVVFLDPPRKGCSPLLLQELLTLLPQKITYISCNPATLARDLKILCETKYDLKSVTPVDMFPHTTHLETIAVLTQKMVK